jgi:hypothetical protein
LSADRLPKLAFGSKFTSKRVRASNFFTQETTFSQKKKYHPRETGCERAIF